MFSLRSLSLKILLLLFLALRVKTECMNNTVRLVNGPTSNEGRVEVCFNGTWGTVCDDLWDAFDAAVVCRQLGIPSRAAYALRYSGGVGPINLDNVECFGPEEKLADCPANEIGNHDCDHFEDAGVVCIEAQSMPICTTNQIRLVSALGINETEGRLEFCHNGVWGTACSRPVNPAVAVVACRELGFNTTAAFVQQDNPGHGPVFLSSLYCSGNEERVADCTYAQFDGSHDCSHSQDFVISCITKAECTHNDARLVGGRNFREGRVEICVNGAWGTVCDDGWDLNDALVVCKQMGMLVTAALVGSFGAGNRSNPIMLDSVTCNGNEPSLLLCPNRGINTHNCIHEEDAGVICITSETQQVCAVSTIQVRNESGLYDGNGGYLEICVNGTWSTICSNSFWTVTNAAVACRQLGFNLSSAPVPLSFTRINGAVVEYRGRCSGNEESLFNCLNPEIAISACQTSSLVGILCQNVTDATCANNDIRLAGTNVESRGRLEICLNGVWGTVCDDRWTDINSRVVCRQLGYKSNGARSLFGFTPIGQGPIFLDNVRCFGQESNILACDHNTLGEHDCQHAEDIGVFCPPSEVNIATTEVNSNSKEASTFMILGISLSGAVALLIASLVIVVVVICCRRQRKSKLKMLNDHPDMRQRYDIHEHLTLSISNEYRQQDNVTSNQLQVHLRGYMQRSSSLSCVRASFIRQLTEAFIIPLQRIKLMQQIGEGEFGIVYMGLLQEKDHDGFSQQVYKKVAIKTLKGHFEQAEIDKVMEESLKMKHFDHQNILSLIGVCTEARPAPYIVMPYMPNGSLLEFLRKQRAKLLLKESADMEDYTVIDVEKRLLVMCSQIAQGMKYLANERFVHRDLAARNCMLDEEFILKISDFGLSEDVYARNYYKQQRDAGIKLPVKWMAPESLQDGIFSEKSDVWAYGVTCWEVFNGGKNPYPGMNPYTVAEMIESGERLQKPTNAACSEETYKLMMMCWSEEPQKRPHFSDIVKMVDNRLGVIAGYLDVGYNPFINPGSVSQESDNGHEQKEAPLLLQPDREKPPVKPRTKKPTIIVTDSVKSSAGDEGNYY